MISIQAFLMTIMIVLTMGLMTFYQNSSLHFKKITEAFTPITQKLIDNSNINSSSPLIMSLEGKLNYEK